MVLRWSSERCPFVVAGVIRSVAVREYSTFSVGLIDKILIRKS